MINHTHLIVFKPNKDMTLKTLRRDLPQLSGHRQILRIGHYGYDLTINTDPTSQQIKDIIVTSNEPLDTVEHTLTLFFNECQNKPTIHINHQRTDESNTVYGVYDTQRKQWRTEEDEDKDRLLSQFRDYWFGINYDSEYEDIIQSDLDESASKKQVEQVMHQRAYGTSAENYLKQCGFTIGEKPILTLNGVN